MITVNWQYIIINNDASTGYRIARRKPGQPLPVVDSGQATNGEPASGGMWNQSAPPVINYPPNPPNKPTPPIPYTFAFWSVLAQQTDAPFLVIPLIFDTGTLGNFNPSAGDWILTAKAWYRWAPGSGPGQEAVEIDAFDQTSLDWMPDDFVDVTPDDKSKTLTLAANNGYIDSSVQIKPGNPITIRARENVGSPVIKQFADWLPAWVGIHDTNNPSTVGSPDQRNIVAQSSDDIIAYAFYTNLAYVPKEVPVKFDPLWWLKQLGLGPHIPNPSDPISNQAAAAIALLLAARNVSPELRASVLELALRQGSLTSAAIKMELKRIQQQK